MGIRWRLTILFLQLVFLTIGTYVVTHEFISTQTWYFAGILAVIINPQLLEPYYPKLGDVVGNSIVCIVLLVSSPQIIAKFAWNVFLIIFLFILILGLLAIIFGAGKKTSKSKPLANVARALSQQATARRLYSIVFWLALIEYYPLFQAGFWLLGLTWLSIVTIGLINWQNLWGLATGRSISIEVEGSIGPSRLIVSAPDIPPPSSRVRLKSRGDEINATVLGRVHRGDDVWAQLFIDSCTKCEEIRKFGISELILTGEDDNTFLGVADVGSTDKSLRFITNQKLNVGHVVAVTQDDTEILYQITGGRVEELSVPRGSNLVVRVDCSHLGRNNLSANRLERVRWTPTPGAPVRIPSISLHPQNQTGNIIQLGTVIGTNIPITLNSLLLCQGHLAILGMTRMGKTSLAVRIAESLAKNRRVVILDQTGEYIGKRNLSKYDKEGDWAKPGLSVLEPRPEDVVLPKFADEFFKKVTKEAVEGYLKGDPSPRVLIIDEAHQFVPEPAGIGFGAAGRDEAIHFGLLMMQVRKYGIAIVLISQRTAVVAKSALSQCENLIAFKSVDQTGLDYLEAVAGEGIRELLPQLHQGEALVFGPAISADGPVAITVTFP